MGSEICVAPSLYLELQVKPSENNFSAYYSCLSKPISGDSWYELTNHAGQRVAPTGKKRNHELITCIFPSQNSTS